MREALGLRILFLFQSKIINQSIKPLTPDPSTPIMSTILTKPPMLVGAGGFKSLFRGTIQVSESLLDERE